MTFGYGETKALKEVAVGFNQAIEKLKNFGPSVQSLRVDYQDRTSVMKMKVQIPDSALTAVRKLQIPGIVGYRIDEVYDSGQNRIPVVWEEGSRHWLASAKQFSRGETLLVILKGQITKEALDELVEVRAPVDPERQREQDLYWLHSSIKDAGMLETIYSDLNIDKVDVSVGVGVERSFSASIPDKVKNVMKRRQELQQALTGRQRELQRLRAQLRSAETVAGHTTINQVLEIMDKLVAGELFRDFVNVAQPYQVTNITPRRETTLIPTNVNVGVRTDLSFSQPAVKGNLTFAKKAFQDKVEADFAEVIE
ncbi:MAG: hypothetical protein AABX89_07660 [Candidatus Thermoplasmatota archaeon]